MSKQRPPWVPCLWHEFQFVSCHWSIPASVACCSITKLEFVRVWLLFHWNSNRTNKMRTLLRTAHESIENHYHRNKCVHLANAIESHTMYFPIQKDRIIFITWNCGVKFCKLLPWCEQVVQISIRPFHFWQYLDHMCQIWIRVAPICVSEYRVHHTKVPFRIHTIRFLSKQLRQLLQFHVDRH